MMPIVAHRLFVCENKSSYDKRRAERQNLLFIVIFSPSVHVQSYFRIYWFADVMTTLVVLIGV